jgi:hypothetical protein
MSLWPTSLSRVYIDTDNDEFMTQIIPSMVKALEDNKPLTDDIFGLPDDVDY